MSWRYQRVLLGVAWTLAALASGPVHSQPQVPALSSDTRACSTASACCPTRTSSLILVLFAPSIVQVPDRWRNLPVVDGAGATLLPGLIDAHTHTRTVAQLQDALRFGVTTVLDMWSPEGDRALREAAARRTDISDFRSSGILATVPGGHGTEYGIPIPTVSGPDAAASFVAARVAEGADYLKIVLNGVRAATNGTPTMDAATARALVEAAHARNLLVVAHIENLNDVRIAVTSGVDGLAHIWREGGDAPDVARLVVDHHVFVVLTLAVPDGFVPGTGAALAADRRLKPFLSAD